MLPAQLWKPCLAILSTLEPRGGQGLGRETCAYNVWEGPSKEQVPGVLSQSFHLVQIWGDWLLQLPMWSLTKAV